MGTLRTSGQTDSQMHAILPYAWSTGQNGGPGQRRSEISTKFRSNQFASRPARVAAQPTDRGWRFCHGQLLGALLTKVQSISPPLLWRLNSMDLLMSEQYYTHP